MMVMIYFLWVLSNIGASCRICIMGWVLTKVHATTGDPPKPYLSAYPPPLPPLLYPFMRVSIGQDAPLLLPSCCLCTAKLHSETPDILSSATGVWGGKNPHDIRMHGCKFPCAVIEMQI